MINPSTGRCYFSDSRVEPITWYTYSSGVVLFAVSGDIFCYDTEAYTDDVFNVGGSSLRIPLRHHRFRKFRYNTAYVNPNDDLLLSK